MGEPGEKSSKYARYQELNSHMFQVRQSTRGYTHVVTHPVTTPSDWA